MTWQYPRRQLLREAGRPPGERNLFPLTYEDIANTPEIAQSVDNPWANKTTYLSVYHDFFTTNTGQDWTMTNVGVGSGVATLTAERNGAIQLQSGTSNSGYTLYAVGDATIIPFVSTRHPYMETRAVLLSALGTAAVRHMGFGNDYTAASPNDFIGFRVTGTGNWFAVTRSGGTETTTDTGIAAALNTWYLFRMWVDGRGTRVWMEMLSDANPRVRLFGPVQHTANIPTGGLAMGLRVANPNPAEGATRNFGVDHIAAYQLRQAA